MNERDVFIAARQLKSANDRRTYLDNACLGDAPLRRRVDELLRADDLAGSFLCVGPAAYLPTLTERPIAETPGSSIGPYKLLEQIGEGGFGVVFMAEQSVPVKRRVALKVIKPGMDTRQVIARFEAERQALAMMDHPNIAKVLDAGGTETGRPYFVMELVRGVPITEYCDQHSLSLSERLDLIITVCQAVQHAHQKGVIHRDIKPSNVLVSEQDDKPLVKVIDFGISKATVGHLTDKTLFTGFCQVVGTPLYMSPEQASMGSLDVDTRSDIYSLGVVLYELLTGTTPYEKSRVEHATFDDIRRMIREEEHPKPSTRLCSMAETLPHVSAVRRTEPRKLSQMMRGDLDWIVMKALEKDRSRRYRSASELSDDVARFLAVEPVSACPPTFSYRFRKFARRNQAALAMSGVVLFAALLGILGLAVSNVLIRAERNEKVEALKARSQALSREVVANNRLSESLAAERAQRLRAEANMLLTLRSLGLAYERTRGAAGGERQSNEQRRRSLEREVALYEEFAHGAAAGDSSAVRFETAKASLRLGRLYLDLERKAEAERAYRVAATSLESLARSSPSSAEYRRELYIAQWWLGDVLRQLQRPAEAEQYLRASISSSEQLVAEVSPPLYEDCRHLGVSFEALAIVYQTIGRSGEAAALTQQRIDFAQRLVDQFPANRQYCGLLADAHYRQGIELMMAGRIPEAVEPFQSAIALWDMLAVDAPGTVDYRLDFARGYAALAGLEKHGSAREDARQSFEEAFQRFGRVAAASSEDPDRCLDVCLAYTRLGQFTMTDPEWDSETARLDSALMSLLNAIEANESLSISQRETIGHRLRQWGCPLLDANVHLVCAERTLGGAVRVFEGLTSEAPDGAGNWHYLADTRRRLGRLLELTNQDAEAEAEYRAAIAIHGQRAAEFPDHPEFLDEWSLSHFDLGRFLMNQPEQQDAGILSLTEAVRLKSNSLDYWRELGIALYRSQRWGEAVIALEKPGELGSPVGNSETYLLAMSWWHLGAPEKARIWFDEGDRQSAGHRDDEILQLRRSEAANLLGVENVTRVSP